MNSLKTVATTLCYLCISVSLLSVLTPQKRTRRIMGFVTGMFLISSIVTAVSSQAGTLDWNLPDMTEQTITPSYSEEDYQNAVAQQTADNVTEAMDTLLKNEGIAAEDIQITLKISDEGRISVVRAVIYISETARDRIDEIRSIVYRNLSKEPEIYVEGEEIHGMVS